MAGQLWLLSEKLVGLTLFDDELNNETKNEMVLAMKEKETGDPLKRAMIDLELNYQITLLDFTSKNSPILFKNCIFLIIFLNFQQISGSINPALMMQKASSVQWPSPMIMLNMELL